MHADPLAPAFDSVAERTGMEPQQIHDDVATEAPSARTTEHRAIADRIVHLQTWITANRRRLDRLHAHQDDRAERLQNDLHAMDDQLRAGLPMRVPASGTPQTVSGRRKPCGSPLRTAGAEGEDRE